MPDDPRAIRSIRIAYYRELLRGPLLPNDRADLRWKLDHFLRLQECNAPLSREELDYAAVLSGEAMRAGDKRGAADNPAPVPGLAKRAVATAPNTARTTTHQPRLRLTQ